MPISVKTFQGVEEAERALAASRSARYFGGGTLVMRAANAGDQTFDTIVSVFSLCSVGSVGRVLHEIQRVLRPEGAFVFLEHGLAHDFFTAQWQRRLDPVQRRLFGCRLDLAVDRLIVDSGLRLDLIQRVLLTEGPSLTAQLYRGVARHEEATTSIPRLRSLTDVPALAGTAPAALAR